MCDTETKICSKCGEEKPLTAEYFNRNKYNKDGFFNFCSFCRRKSRKNTYSKLTQEQKNSVKKRASEWNKKRRDEIRSKNSKLLKSKKYHIDWNRNKAEKDFLFKLSTQIRPLLGQSFKRMGWSKKSKTQDILGCDWETFVEHIENQFKEGMTWENHGRYGWHYDHIIPIASAETEEDVIRLNHYTNFQPLWAEDNLRKSDKISEEWGNLENTNQIGYINL